MTDKESTDKGSFWTTLPGILTGVTGLILAISALITALVTTGVIGNRPHQVPASPQPTASQVAPVATSPVPSISSGRPEARVWVNMKSGIYHCTGKTLHGKHMTQKEAQEKGYKPAYGKVCS